VYKGEVEAEGEGLRGNDVLLSDYSLLDGAADL